MPSFLKTFDTSKTRSMPPMTSCLRNSSGAMRMKRVVGAAAGPEPEPELEPPSALDEVLKGLAAAPPCDVHRMGVSTSTN